MPFIEQLLYGHDHLSETGERQELAHSAGIGAEVSAEIRALCDAWGQAPELGLQSPVLMTHPLRSSMPSMRGRLYSVICVVASEPQLFHAIVVTDAAYGHYGRNPYALARAVEFCTEWNGSQGMDRVEIEPENQSEFLNPPACAEDVGLVDEAVLQFILTGMLQLPLEQAVRSSDRAMALIIACLPQKDRKELHFASFTTTQVNAYDVSGLETEGATFAGWQRLMMARIDSGVTEQQQQYKELIAEYLALGDMEGIARISSRHNFQAPAKSDLVVATREKTQAPQSVPRQAPISPAPTSIGSAATLGAGGSGAPGPGFGGPGRRPMIAGHNTASHRGPLPDHGLDPAAQQPRTSRRSRPSWTRGRGGAALARGQRGAGGRILRTISVLLLLFGAGWVGTMWLDGRTLSESLEWAGLPGMDGRTESFEHAGTLLEVVDVGRVYDRARKHAGSQGFGLNASGDKGREKALGQLQSSATKPLLGQVALFVKLSAEGIQQSGRQDREVERLDALAKQGAVLEKELARLELAWYSFTTGVNWTDLGKLSDTAVEARRDSLDRVESGTLADVRLGMGTGSSHRDLATARRHMDSMAVVVRLFQAKSWSPSWEKELLRAAEKVSPSAGRTTRAYRNSAFALVRLKRAERKAANESQPFAALYDSGQWPSAQVKALLPRLRREAGRFSDKNAPELLGATLSLYTALEASERTIDRILESPRYWQQLRGNAAVRFDPRLYDNFLERLRYEAAGRAVAKQANPAAVPEHLYQGAARAAVVAFADSLTTLTQAEQWRAVSATVADPFLGRWADHLAGDMLARLAHLQQEFDVVWADCRVEAVALQGQAKAGYDWTSGWLKLRTAANEAEAKYAATLGEDPVQRARFDYLQQLVWALDRQRPLKMARVTVRFDQARLPGPTTVQLELRTPVRGGVWTSEPFAVGPSAPAGTGWVGTTFLNWIVPVSPHDQMSGRVVTATDHQELLEVSFASLADGAGPAQMVRPCAGELGSLSFRLELEEYWSSLEIPDLGPVF